MSVTNPATTDDALDASGDVADATEMTDELDRLQASIVSRLRLAGIAQSDAGLTAVVDGVLNDAVRVALLWLGERGDSFTPVHPPDSRRTDQRMPTGW